MKSFTLFVLKNYTTHPRLYFWVYMISFLNYAGQVSLILEYVLWVMLIVCWWDGWCAVFLLFFWFFKGVLIVWSFVFHFLWTRIITSVSVSLTEGHVIRYMPKTTQSRSDQLTQSPEHFRFPLKLFVLQPLSSLHDLINNIIVYV